MTTRAVHWHEGLFLRPHHFQASQRYLSHLGARNQQWDVHYNWGLRSIDIDLDALANFRFVVRSLDARFRDGTIVSLPLEGALADLDLRAAFQESSSFIVYLATPALHLGSPNTGLTGRYRMQTFESEDENTGVNPQSIPLRYLNLRLMTGSQDQTGYETLPLARVEKSARAESTPQLDGKFVPPVLACDAWAPLAQEILGAIHARIGKKIDWLANQIATQGITFDRGAPGDSLILDQLAKLNEAWCQFGVLLHAQGIHPFWAFLELSRVVGQLAIFSAARRPPDLPHYDHDDLGTGFHRLKQALDTLLNIVEEPKYKERAFVGAGFRMQVALEPSWLEASMPLYIGVTSSLDADNTVKLLTKPGMLDMKVGSSERVDNIFRQGLPGLKFAPVPRPPQQLPTIPGVVYFQVMREAKDEEWQFVQKGLQLAVRLNENLIVGSIQNQRVLTIKGGNMYATLQFTLYVLP